VQETSTRAGAPVMAGATRPGLPRADRGFSLGVVLAFLPCALFAMSHHELSRDEMQAWLLARDSPTPFVLFRNMAYEGHPPLWHLALLVVTRLSPDPRAMCALHVAIGTAVVWLAAAYAPLPRPLRALFAFGYFPLYEYLAISRGYGLGVLLALAFAVSFPERRARPLLAGSFLALLALTSAVGWLVACAAIVVLAGEQISQRKARGWYAVGVANLGLMAGLYCLVPKPGQALQGSGPFRGGPLGAIALVMDAMVPIPPLRPSFWGDNVLDHLGPLTEALPVVGVLLVAWMALVVLRAPVARAFYLVGTALLVAFFAVLHLGQTRHFGYLFVVFFLSVWLDGTIKGSAPPGRTGYVTLVLVLGAQVVGAGVALTQEARYVFAPGEQAAAWIRASGLAGAPLVLEPDWASLVVLGVLDRADGWSAETRRRGSFVSWTSDRQAPRTDGDVVSFALDIARTEQRDALLVTNRPLSPGALERARVVKQASFTASISDETYLGVYVVPFAQGGS